MNWSLRALFINVQTCLIAILAALPVWVILRRPWKRPNVIRETTLAVFISFMAGLLCLTLEGEWTDPVSMLSGAWERLHTADRIHVVPFQTIISQLRSFSKLTSLTQLLGNTVLFAPWGFFLPLLWPRFRPFWRMIGMALLLTCFIECMQLFIDRYVEIDDILLNFLGSMAGYGLWTLLHRTTGGLDDYLQA